MKTIYEKMYENENFSEEFFLEESQKNLREKLEGEKLELFIKINNDLLRFQHTQNEKSFKKGMDAAILFSSC